MKSLFVLGFVFLGLPALATEPCNAARAALRASSVVKNIMAVNQAQVDAPTIHSAKSGAAFYVTVSYDRGFFMDHYRVTVHEMNCWIGDIDFYSTEG